MGRTRPTGITTSSRTSSGFGGEDFKGPEDLSDVTGIETEIPRGQRTPSPSLPSSPSPRPPAGGIDLSKPGEVPFGGMEPKRGPGRSPIGLEVGKSAGGGLGIGISVPIGGPISARGGVNIGQDGAIKGGQVGLGIGAGPIGASIDVGTDQDEKGRGGCYQYVTVSLGPFSHTYGRNVCESPTPTPTPTPTSNLPPGALTPTQIDTGMLGSPCGTLCVTLHNHFDSNYENPYVTGTESICLKPRRVRSSVTGKLTNQTITSWESEYVDEVWDDEVKSSLAKWDKAFKDYSIGTYSDYYTVSPTTRAKCFPSPSPSPSPCPTYNPPPRKKMNNECCKILALYHQEQLRLMGRPLGPQGQLIPIPSGTYFNKEIERIQTPIENIQEPVKEKIKFNNFYELLMYGLNQQINLDIGIDPQSFVPPTGKLQNPEYQRDSEESLKENTQPNTDKAGNKRELEIGNQVKINSLSQQQQYIFEALRRWEYLFPSGELFDAKFKKSLIIPGAEGELKIHNLIHFSEFLVQYLNATLGNPKIPIKIEDTNAIKEGKQSATFNHFSISHMIREMYKLILESGDDINAIMETGIRDFRTNLANRIQIVQIAEMCQALIQDTGMLESQEFIPIKLDGDPYAGKWKAGMGFEPDADLDSNEEKATEKLMKATLKNFQAQVKVIRRDGRENADIRDLLLQLAEMFTRSTSIPATKEGIEKALAAAKFKVKVDNALSRTQVKRAAAAKLSRTKKRNR